MVFKYESLFVVFDITCLLITGIVIKYENMSYKTSVHYASLILGLTGKAKKYISDLFDYPDVSLSIMTLYIHITLSNQRIE